MADAEETDSDGAVSRVSEEESNVPKKKESLSLRDILLLQFQIHFELLLLFGIYISYICAVLDSSNAFATSLELIKTVYSPKLMNIIYTMDIFYLIDVILMILYKNLRWEKMQQEHKPRGYFLVCLDIVSLIPYDLIYFYTISRNMHIVYGLRLRYTLRIYRIFSKFNRIRTSIGMNSLLMINVEFVTIFTMFLATVSGIHYRFYCQINPCPDATAFLEGVCYQSVLITTIGFNPTVNLPPASTFLMLIVTIAAYIFINSFIMCLYISSVIKSTTNRFLYNERVRIVVKRLIIGWRINDPLIMQTVIKYYWLFWANCEGMKYAKLETNLTIPEIMYKEIYLDTFWEGLKHSHLFRNQEVHFLRHLSLLVKCAFMIPGEVIFKRGRSKSRMVYIVSGIAHILSDEDGETPILTLTSGTCVGETSLLLDYHSNCTVICQNCCEVQILTREDFLRVMVQYPEVYQNIRKDVEKRFRQAITLQKMKSALSVLNEVEERLDVLTLKWIKYICCLLTPKSKKKLQISLEDRLLVATFNKLIFCPKYLDLLVVSEQIEIVTDPLFLRNTCPCVFQPDSFVIRYWRKLIALLAILLAVFYPYYFAFNPVYSGWYTFLVYAVNFMWILDAYFDISTAIVTKHRTIKKVKAILLFKLTSSVFFVNFLAAIPLHALFYLAYYELSPQKFSILHANLLLKLSQIKVLFATKRHEVWGTFLKYVTYTVLTTYFVAAFFYLIMCFENVCLKDDSFLLFVEKYAGSDVRKRIHLGFFFAVQLVTFASVKLHMPGKFEHFYMFFVVVGFLTKMFYIYYIANTTAAITLRLHNKAIYMQSLDTVNSVMSAMCINEVIRLRVMDYYKIQWATRFGIDIIYGGFVMKGVIPKELYIIIRGAAYGSALRKIPIFFELSEQIIVDLSTRSAPILLQPNEIITYAGEICKGMYIIEFGYCRVSAAKNGAMKIIGPGDSFAVVETCMKIPVVNRVITITVCQLVLLSEEGYQQSLAKYPEVNESIQKVIAESTAWKNYIDMGTEEIFHEDTSKLKSVINPSFKHFGYRLQSGTKEGDDYHDYFDKKLHFFNFIKYFMMRTVILTQGKFLFYWDFSRCIFAFFSTNLGMIPMLNSCSGCVWFYVLLFLDLTAWIDVYLRHHISYYNNDGLEVTHPLKTAVRYWKNGFITDFLGSFPLDILVINLCGVKQSNYLRALLRSNRLLQIYRVCSLGANLERNSLKSHIALIDLKYVPYTVMFLNLIGALVANFKCEFGDHIPASEFFTEGVKCYKETFFVTSKFSKPLSPWRTYLYGVYFTTTIATSSCMHGFSIASVDEAIEVTALAFGGFLYCGFLMVKIISLNLRRNTDLTAYQEQMTTLMKFLSYKRIDQRVKTEVVEYYEFVWRTMKGQTMHNLIKTFNNALQEDILFNIYGKVLQESEVFEGANESFFRSLLMNVRHIPVIRKGIIIKVNDISGHVYILFKGTVEVLGPDYSRLVILPPGSIFGNLQDCTRTRYAITFVAKSHVDVLRIPSKQFFKIVSKYPKLQTNLKHLTIIHFDYIAGGPTPPILPYATETEGVKTQLRSIFLRAWQINLYIRIVEYLTVFLCLVSFWFEMYQKTLVDCGYIFIFLYCFDFLFLVHMFIKFHVVYEDEDGMIVTDMKLIANRYLKDPFGFWLDAFSLMPIELITFGFLNSTYTCTVLSYCRSNRVIRILVVIRYFRSKTGKLNINVYLIRMAYLITWITIIIPMMTWTVLTLICYDPKFSVFPQPTCNFDNQTAFQKFSSYFEYTNMVVHLFTVTETSIYPESVLLIFAIIAILIFAKFLIIIFIAESCAVLEIARFNQMNYENDVDRIKQFMMREKVSPALLRRICKYISLLWNHQKGLQFPILLESAPYYLKEAVLNSMFGFHLRRHPVLRKCHTDLIRQMAASMTTRTFFPGDYIVFKGDIDGTMYFIHEGRVKVLSKDTEYVEVVEQTLRTSQMFGLAQGLYKRCGHEFTYLASAYTVVVLLERTSWIDLLKFFPASKTLIFDENEEKLDYYMRAKPK